jgi:hypothetical protein
MNSQFSTLAQSLRCWHFALPACGTRVQTRRTKQTTKTNCERKSSMKVKQVLTICGVVAALCVSAASLQAQQDNGGGNGGGRRRNGGGGGGGGGGGNFDPAQFQQQRMDNIRETLGFTNDTDWNAVQPLVQKVDEARRDVGFGGRGFGRRGGGGGGQGGGGGGGRGGFGGTPSPEQEALQKAIDDNAPSAQIKAALAKYETSRKEKQAKLEAAQAELRKVLSVKQEAQATLLGLLQ